jgi:hypothetical protein
MLPIIVCLVAGFVCGLLLLHWLALAFVCAGASLAFVLASRWDWLLIPKWFGLLAVFELAYLGGIVVKILVKEAQCKRPSNPVAADEKPGRQSSSVRRVARRRGARPEPQVRA